MEKGRSVNKIVCALQQSLPVVPVAPSRRRRPSPVSAAPGADDEAMEWKGRLRAGTPPAPLSALEPRLRPSLWVVHAHPPVSVPVRPCPPSRRCARPSRASGQAGVRAEPLNHSF